MDDKPKSQRTGRRVCHACRQRHPADHFVDEELKKTAVERVRKSSQRRFRFTPGDSLSCDPLLSYSSRRRGPRRVTASDHVALGSPHNEDVMFWPDVTMARNGSESFESEDEVEVETRFGALGQ